jgi:hypothetical protein
VTAVTAVTSMTALATFTALAALTFAVVAVWEALVDVGHGIRSLPTYHRRRSRPKNRHPKTPRTTSRYERSRDRR